MRWIPLIGCWMIAASALAGGEVVLFSDDFSADMGWTGYEAGYWERGSAVAGGGTQYGNPDPGQDHSPTSDNFLIGIRIGGDFSTAVNGPHYLTSPVIDCSGASAWF